MTTETLPDERDDDERQALEEAAAAVGPEIVDYLASSGWAYDSWQVNGLPVEHRWQRGNTTISVTDGCLSYARGGYEMIRDLPVTPQQLADILATLGIVPVDVTTGWRAVAKRLQELAADLYDAEAEVERLTQAVERLRMAYGLARRRADRWRRRADGEIGWQYDRDDEPTGAPLPDGVEGRPVGRGVAR